MAKYENIKTLTLYQVNNLDRLKIIVISKHTHLYKHKKQTSEFGRNKDHLKSWAECRMYKP